MNARRNFLIGIGAVTLLCLAGLYIAPDSHVATLPLPDGLSDAEFWNLVEDFSEPGGFFRSDNFVSNETTSQYVIPELEKRTKPGGIYLGVGPDQNFTYILAIRPKLAFITDIRRQNMMLHLLYKALFELSHDRAEFLSKLFARRFLKQLTAKTSTEQLFELASAAPSDPELSAETLEEVLDHLRGHHQFALNPEDVKSVEYVYRSFAAAGPDIRYSFPSQYGWRRFPSYAELMLETDEEGENHSYMASEENFRIIKQLETENRILPLVGDFAGEKALRSVGRYLKDHGATVTAFYTSNVEFYLFQSEDWKKFFNNVANLPLDDNSLFIRAYFNNYGLRFPNQGGGARSLTLLDGMSSLVAAFDGGRVRTYFDVIKRSSR